MNLNIKKISLVFCASLISFNAFSDNVALKSSHPSEYTVVKGDTLWDISGKFLQNPWQWGSIWKMNKDIKNPNSIYPGETIVLTYVNGEPKLSLKGGKSEPVNGQLEFYPHTRISDISNAIGTIPQDKIAKYMTSPRIVSQNELDNAPYVVEFKGDHLLAGKGSDVYVKNLKEGVSDYVVYRQGDTYTDPVTHKILGYEAVYSGDAYLKEMGDPSTITITNASSEIKKGERLLSKEAESNAITFIPSAPDTKIDAVIISAFNKNKLVGNYEVVVLNKGKNDGLKIGNVLTIFTVGKAAEDKFAKKESDDFWSFEKKAMVKLPDQNVGDLMVFRLFDEMSYALVMKTSAEVKVLDYARSPK